MKIPSAIESVIQENICFDKIGQLPAYYADLQNFNKIQEGYRWNAMTGEDYTSDGDGGWKTSWYVIALNVMDEPFFVDFSEDTAGYPVYYAYHGMGRWEAITVANNLQSFREILHTLKNKESELPFDLEFLSDYIDIDNDFWKEVNAYCKEEED